MPTHSGNVEELDVPTGIQLELSSTMSNANSNKDHPILTNSGRVRTNSDSGSSKEFRLTSPSTNATSDDVVDLNSISSSSMESLNVLLERQHIRQLNHPQHQEHIKASQSLPPLTVKETNSISLKFDPVSKRKVLNTYEIISELGSGEHGKVKLAKEIITDTLVAIKIVDRHEKSERKFFSFRKPTNVTNDKIKKEIAIMKKCNHKHVVKLLEVLDDLKSKKIYLVLEYCAKGEVKWCAGDVLETEARGPPLLSFQRVREILRGVTLGLEYLHFQGIIHRDIKPANLLLTEDGTVKISDFGVSMIAHVTDSKGVNSINELELAKTVGTPAFFAPEICLGSEAESKFNLTKKLHKNSKIFFMIDIWALGTTLYCLLFGMLPFISEFELQLFEKIVSDPLTFPDYDTMKSNGCSNISSIEEYHEAKDILEKLLIKNPSKRISIDNIKQHRFTCWDYDNMTESDLPLKERAIADKSSFLCSQNVSMEQLFVTSSEMQNAVYNISQDLSKQSLTSSNIEVKYNNTSSTSTSDSSSQLYRNEIGNSSNRANSFGDTEPNSSMNNVTQQSNDYNQKTNTSQQFSAREIFEKELSEFDNKHKEGHVVNLPINSSFASLDSFYIDNYAMSKMGMDSILLNDPEKQSSSTQNKPPTFGSLVQLQRRNDNTRNSSSRLNLFTYGMPSTTTDRAPRNTGFGDQSLRGFRGSGIGLSNANRNLSSRQMSRGMAPLEPFTVHKTHANDSVKHHNGNNTSTRQPTPKSFNNSKSSNHHTSNKKGQQISPTKPNFKIKKGNFFNNFNGQDEDSSSSPDISESEGSQITRGNSNSTSNSNAESSPFEFGLDHQNEIIHSPKELRNINTEVPLFTRNDIGTIMSDDSSDEDGLTLNMGSNKSLRSNSLKDPIKSPRDSVGFHKKSASDINYAPNTDFPTQTTSIGTNSTDNSQIDIYRSITNNESDIEDIPLDVLQSMQSFQGPSITLGMHRSYSDTPTNIDQRSSSRLSLSSALQPQYAMNNDFNSSNIDINNNAHNEDFKSMLKSSLDPIARRQQKI